MRWEFSIIPRWRWFPNKEVYVCNTAYRWFCFRLTIKSEVIQPKIEVNFSRHLNYCRNLDKEISEKIQANLKNK